MKVARPKLFIIIYGDKNNKGHTSHSSMTNVKMPSRSWSGSTDLHPASWFGSIPVLERPKFYQDTIVLCGYQ